MRLKYSLIVITAILTTLLSGFFLIKFTQQQESHPRLIPDQVMTVLVDPKPLREFSLIDHHNHEFNLSVLKGKWSFLFFGFIQCPDICPTTLASLSKIRSQITKGDNTPEQIQFIFISVDPKRDTAQKLKQYTNYFDSSFIGVTGTETELHNLANQLDATFDIQYKPNQTDDEVIHTSAVFLVNPQGQYQVLITPPFDIETISRRFSILRKIDALNLTKIDKSL